MKISENSKKRSLAYGLLIFASIFLYVILTGSKNLYTAEKTTFYGLGTFGNLTDLASTMEYYFYTYAAMQIALIFFVKRMNIKWFLTLTVGASAALTLIIPLTSEIGQHYVIFAINGVLQAGIWGCLLKVLSVHLPSRLLATANQTMAAGPAIVGALAYGVAAAFGDNWRAPFFVLGIVLFAAVALYFFAVTYASRFPKEEELCHVKLADGTEADISVDDNNDFIGLVTRRRVVCFYGISLVMCFLFTSLYFMVNNNLDMYFKEIGGFSNDVSKWLTVFAPVFAVIGPTLCVRGCEKRKNFIVVCAVFFGAALVFAGLLLLFFDKSVAVSLILLVLFLVAVNGGRSITLSIASLRMRSRIDTGVYSTAVNAISSIASGVSPKIITVILDNTSLTENESWRRSFLIIFFWTLTVVLLLIMSILLVRMIRKRDGKPASAELG